VPEDLAEEVCHLLLLRDAMQRWAGMLEKGEAQGDADER